MKSTLSETSATERIIDIEIPREKLEEIFDQKVRKYRKEIKLPGFRSGNIPKQVVATRFKAPITQESMQQLLEDAVRESCKEHQVEPVAPGKVDELKQEDGQPIRFKVIVEVDPPLDLQDYKLDVPIEPQAVIDEMIEDQIAQMRRRSAVDKPVDRAATLGDVVNAEYLSIIIDGEPRSLPENRQIRVKLGEGSVKDFDDQLVGTKSDDVKVVKVAFPEDHSNEALKGKSAEYELKVLEVAEENLPVLDETFAKLFGLESVEELKKSIRKDMERNFHDQARNHAWEEGVRRLIEANPFEVPKARVRYYLDRRFGHQHEEGEEHEHHHDHEHHFTIEQEQQAIYALKRARILEEVSRKEKIKATQAEVDHKVMGLAAQYHMEFERLKTELRRSGRIMDIREEIKMEKTMDFVIGFRREEAPAEA